MRLGEWRRANVERNERNAHHFHHAFWNIVYYFSEPDTQRTNEGGVYALIITQSKWWRSEDQRRRARQLATTRDERAEAKREQKERHERAKSQCAPEDYETRVEVPF